MCFDFDHWVFSFTLLYIKVTMLVYFLLIINSFTRTYTFTSLHFTVNLPVWCWRRRWHYFVL